MFDILEIDVTDLQHYEGKHIFVDVREPHELLGPEGQIEGIISVPLGTPLSQFFMSADPHQSYVFICRSGHRSHQACEIAHAYGFHNVYNMKGGMIAWRKNH